MTNEKMKSTLDWIGIIFGGMLIIKMSIIGYYPREWPLLAALLIISAISFFIASKIKTKEEKV